MKKIAIFLLLISTLFIACETDFEVNADWKEVMVVYGLLDQSQPQQYIKINKAFLGEGDALQMASVSGSVNYNPLDLEVKIYKAENVYNSFDTLFSYLEFYGELYKLKDSIILRDTILEKEDGLFATDENIIYVSSIEDSNFFMSNNAKDKEYILSIVNKKSGKQVWAKTKLIHGLTLDNYDGMKMAFYNPDVCSPNATPPYKKATTTVKWDHSKNGFIYQIISRIYYRNYYNDGTTSLEYLDWVQPTQLYEGSSDMTYEFDGVSFVNFISENIPDMQSEIDYRKLAYTRLQYSVGSEDLNTYMSVNEPFEGIVQERPVFTNINNGIGLFSCRYNIYQEVKYPSNSNWSFNILFTDATSKGLALEFSYLGFQ